MKLRKWRSNSADLLMTVPEEMHEKDELHLISAPSECHKALGIHWHTGKDTLHIVMLQNHDQHTKRKNLLMLQKCSMFWDSLLPPSSLSKCFSSNCGTFSSTGMNLYLELAREWEVWKKQIPLLTDHPIPVVILIPARRRCLYNSMDLQMPHKWPMQG